eukprot:970073-Pelagomonas_calceolata.AAC.3
MDSIACPSCSTISLSSPLYSRGCIVHPHCTASLPEQVVTPPNVFVDCECPKPTAYCATYSGTDDGEEGSRDDEPLNPKLARKAKSCSKVAAAAHQVRRCHSSKTFLTASASVDGIQKQYMGACKLGSEYILEAGIEEHRQETPPPCWPAEEETLKLPPNVSSTVALGMLTRHHPAALALIEGGRCLRVYVCVSCPFCAGKLMARMCLAVKGCRSLAQCTVPEVLAGNDRYVSNPIFNARMGTTLGKTRRKLQFESPLQQIGFNGQRQAHLAAKRSRGREQLQGSIGQALQWSLLYNKGGEDTITEAYVSFHMGKGRKLMKSNVKAIQRQDWPIHPSQNSAGTLREVYISAY